MCRHAYNHSPIHLDTIVALCSVMSGNQICRTTSCSVTAASELRPPEMELYADDNTLVNVLLLSFILVINRCIADRIVNNIKVLVGWPVYGHIYVLHILYTTFV